jgi:hypothetical protein
VCDYDDIYIYLQEPELFHKPAFLTRLTRAFDHGLRCTGWFDDGNGELELAYYRAGLVPYRSQ